MEIFSLLNISENWQESYPVLEIIDMAAELLRKVSETIHAWLVWPGIQRVIAFLTEGNCISETRQEAEKISNIDTYHPHRQCLYDTWEIQSTHFWWVGLCSLQRGLAQCGMGNLPGNMRP